MSSISIIGTGNMARTIGALAVAGGNTVEVIGRDPSKAADLAKTLGGGTTAGDVRRRPGRRHRHPGRAVRQRRSGRQRVRGRAGRQDHRRHHQPLQRQRHRAGRPRRHLHRANGRRGRPRQRPRLQGVQHPLPASSWPRAGRSTSSSPATTSGAKASVAEFIESLRLRPLDVGGLNMAHYLEGVGLVAVGLAQHGVGSLDFALGVTVLG